MHRRNIYGYGGVRGFVDAHADVFALEPAGPGEKCPSIRLRPPQERLAWPVVMSAPSCRYHQLGMCNRGADCRFSHAPEPAPYVPPGVLLYDSSTLQEDWSAQLLLSAPSETQPELLRDRSPGWQAVVEDDVRRSFCMVKRNVWPAGDLMKEFDLLVSNVKWSVLRNKADTFVTRSTAWYVPDGCCCRYTYGETSVDPQERPAWLRAIEARVLGEGCGLAQHEWPTSINMNLYEHEGQNVGWHSDSEGLFRGCESDCRIVSASWGAPRSFEVALKDMQHPCGRPSIFRESLQSVVLKSGDLCSMEGLFQKHYSHQVAKGTPSSAEPLADVPPPTVRVNLTWRYLLQHKPYCPLARRC